ncbi:DUF91 domain-containing protein [Flavisolibacter sp. BT320]|nr:DUF91 domain-containing protein [Flavisolibacter longurius]
MIKEAVYQLGGKATYTQIKDYIHKKWTDVKDSTINAQLIVLSVNQPSRVHYPENSKPRIANAMYDVLFSVGRGQVVQYIPEEHGVWEIAKNEFGALQVRQQIEDDGSGGDGLDEPYINETFLFPIEANLRDFLIQNLHTLKGYNLQLFIDKEGRDGKEYPTAVGPIDILTVDKAGNFVVFEMKLSKGIDKAVGQILRYMGWVKKHLSEGKSVRGIIVANKMDDKILYAVSEVPQIELYEYEMKFELTKVSG